MNSNKSVVAIVATYNGSPWIKKCLSSLKESSILVHTIAIDNASSDNTVEIIEKEFPEVELIKSRKNIGFGKANNIGLKKALERNADYVLLINQDAWVDTDTIEVLIRISKNHPEYGILSPYHLNYEGSATERYFDKWVLKRYTPEYGEDRKTGTVKEIYTSKFVHAACWLMPLSTIKEVGGFDPLFFHYGEDNDYVQRLQYKGLMIGIVPDVKVFHEGSNEGLKNPAENIAFLANQILQRLKSPDASHLGALVLFIRQYLKVINRQNVTLKTAYKENFRNILPIFGSRLEQNKRQAYLN